MSSEAPLWQHRDINVNFSLMRACALFGNFKAFPGKSHQTFSFKICVRNIKLHDLNSQQTRSSSGAEVELLLFVIQKATGGKIQSPDICGQRKVSCCQSFLIISIVMFSMQSVS